MDLSYFQILLSLKSTMDKTANQLRLKGIITAAFTSLINELGCASSEWLAEEFEQNPGERK